MTLVTNPTYDAHRKLLAQHPVYVIERAWNDGKAGIENVNDVYFGSADISEINNAPAWLAARYFPLLDHTTISALTEKIDEKNGTSSIGSMSYNLVDKDGIVTQIMRKAEADTAQSTRRQRDELYIIPTGGDWNSRIKVRTLNVYDSQFDSNKGLYTFQSQSILKWMKQDIFTPKTTTLAVAVTSTSALTVTLTDSTEFLFSTAHTAYGGGANRGFIKINKEIMMWAANASNVLTIPPGGRGMFSTTAAVHAQGDSVQEICVLRGNPYVLALQVLTSTGAQIGGYDILPAHYGLSLSLSDIDTTTWLAVGELRTGLLKNGAGIGLMEGSIEFEFIFSDSIQAKVFIEREILRNTGSFGRVLSDGRYSCKAFNITPQAAMDPATGRMRTDLGYRVLNEDDIVKISPAKANMQKMSSRMELKYLPLPRDKSKDYLRRAVFEDVSSRTRHGPSNTIKYNARGVQADSASVAALYTFFNAVQSRFTSPPVERQVTLRPEHEDIEVGDVVGIDILGEQDVFTTEHKWAASTTWKPGMKIFTTGDYLYEANIASAEGVSGATEPVWGANTVIDGGVTWLLSDGHQMRAYEVMSTSVNLKTGEPVLHLVSQPEEPNWFTPGLGTGPRFSDVAYQVGVDLSLQAGFAVVYGVCETIGPATLAAGDYYFVGDIRFKHTVAISGTVRFWSTGSVLDVLGASIIGGTVKGKAGGIGTVPTSVRAFPFVGSFNNTDGISGGYAGAGGNGGNQFYNVGDASYQGKGGSSLHTPPTRPAITGSTKVSGLLTKISGVPKDLTGSGGGSGGAASETLSYGKGGDGGQGGVGIAIIARNINIPIMTIDVRGENGTDGIKGTGFGASVSGGGGGGGGSVAILMENDGLGGSPFYNAGSILTSGGANGALNRGFLSGKQPQHGSAGDFIVEVF